jgi:hypothetical protein
VGAAGRQRCEDGESECAAELLRGVQQRGSEPAFVDRNAGVGGGGDADEHWAEAERENEHAGEQVVQVGAVDRDSREPVHAGRGDQSAGDDHRSCPDAGQELGGNAGGDPDREAQREVGETGLDR